MLTRAEWMQRRHANAIHRKPDRREYSDGFMNGLGQYTSDTGTPTFSTPDLSQYTDSSATGGGDWQALLGGIQQLSSSFGSITGTPQTALPNSYQGTTAPETTVPPVAPTTPAPAPAGSGFSMSQLFQPPYLYYLMGGAGLLLIVAASGKSGSSGSGGGGNFIKL
jgi:hypothetical protein